MISCSPSNSIDTSSEDTLVDTLFTIDIDCPEDVVQQIQDASSGDQFNNVFTVGKETGTTHTLDEGYVCSLVLEEYWGSVFFDGFVHSFPFPADNLTSVIAEWKLKYPEEIWGLLWNGIIFAIVEEHQGEPRPTLDSIQVILDSVSNFQPHDGLRIGLRIMEGIETDQWLSLILRYPQIYQPAMIEEFAWLRGNRFKLIRQSRVDELEPMLHCYFAHGYARGAFLQQPIQGESEWMSWYHLTRSAEDICPGGYWLGVLRGLRISLGDSGLVYEELDRMPFETVVSWYLEHSLVEDSQSIWTLPSSAGVEDFPGLLSPQ